MLELNLHKEIGLKATWLKSSGSIKKDAVRKNLQFFLT